MGGIPGCNNNDRLGILSRVRGIMPLGRKSTTLISPLTDNAPPDYLYHLIGDRHALPPLGTSSLKVSDLCLGTMTWGEQNTQREAFSQIDRARDAGVNFIDCAEMYPVPPRAETQGASEDRKSVV